MNSELVGAGRPATSEYTGLQPLDLAHRRWPAILAGLLTIAMIVGLGRELFASGLSGLHRVVPTAPTFYLAFAVVYMAQPLFDFVIFRRLWRVPIDGLMALVKKRIANDVVFGYSGDAFFYAWARQRAHIVAAPFGAVKDSSILSAIAGNAVTLAMIAVAAPVGYHLLSPAQLHGLMVSTVVIFAMSLPFLLFSRRVFTLPRGTLWWIFGVQVARLLTGSLAIAVAWHAALPQVALGMWLVLAACRLLVTRLPLVPNKDLLFANLAILLIGHDQALSAVVAFTAALTLVVHGAVIAAIGVRTVTRNI